MDNNNSEYNYLTCNFGMSDPLPDTDMEVTQPETDLEERLDESLAYALT